MKTSLARIFVQHPFCSNCVLPMKKKIMAEAVNVKNVALYSSKSLVVFNFNNVNQVAQVLNTLMALGHPQKGDRISIENSIPPLCRCSTENNSTYNNHYTTSNNSF